MTNTEQTKFSANAQAVQLRESLSNQKRKLAFDVLSLAQDTLRLSRQESPNAGTPLYKFNDDDVLKVAEKYMNFINKQDTIQSETKDGVVHVK